MVTIAVFYGSLAALFALFGLAFLERGVGRRLVFSRLRTQSDVLIVTKADALGHGMIRLWHEGIALSAKVMRAVLAIMIIKVRKLSATLRDIAERRRATPAPRGPVSQFLKTIIDHKHTLHNNSTDQKSS